MEKDARPHVLLLYNALIPSVRLCGHCQLDWLAQKGRLAYRSRQLLRVTRQDLLWADTVVLGRLDDPFALRLAELLQGSGKQLLYILDDDLLNVPQVCTSFPHYAEPGVQRRIRRLLELCDGLITPSPRLAEKYLRPGQKRLMIEEPALEPVAYVPHGEDTVTIGFAGSPDRTKDIEALLGTVLARVKKAYPERVHFEFFGAVPEFAAELDSTVIPYCDSYETYRRTLNSRGWDIGLAPMPDSPFHACKHYNKYCEYAAAGSLGVFSRVEPYTRIPAGLSGAVLCDNDPEAWYSALSRLIEDGTYREALRKQASHMACTELSLATVAEKFADDAGEALAYRAQEGQLSRKFWLYRLWSLLQWARELYGRYGLSVFRRSFQKLRNAFSGGQEHP